MLMDSKVAEELVTIVVFVAGMAILSFIGALVCFFRRAKQVPAASMAVPCNTASSKEVGAEQFGGEELVRVKVVTPDSGDAKALLKDLSYSPPRSLVLVEAVSPVVVSSSPSRQSPRLSPLSHLASTPTYLSRLSRMATLSLSLSPLSPITSPPRLSPAGTGNDSYKDEQLLIPTDENHF